MQRSSLSFLIACWCLPAASGPVRAADNGGNGLPAASATRVRVALYRGPGTGGAGPVKLLERLNQPPQFSVAPISPEEIGGGALANFDVVIFAGGSASKQSETIGDAGREAVRRFVEGGGGYVGICAGAYLATCGSSKWLGLLDAATVSPKWKRGKGQVELELSEAGRKIIGHPAGRFPVRYANGPIVEPAGRDDLPDYEPLAWFRTELAENGTPPGIMVNAPAVFAGAYGRGRAAGVSPHPEQTGGLDHLVPQLVLWVASRPGTGIPGQERNPG